MFQLVVFGAPPAAGQTEGELQSISAHNVPDGGWECDPTEWHFVINQIGSEELAPSSIVVTFDGDGEVNVPLDKFTGSVAHYTTTDNLDDTVGSATASIYRGWEGNFNLSHGPCGEESAEWAHITVVKQVNNDDDDDVQEQFPFSVSTGAQFLLGDGDSKSFDFKLADDESKIVTVSEDVESLDEGWELVSAECAPAQPNPSAASLQSGEGSSGTGQVQVTLSEGDDYTCTFVNAYTELPSPPPALLDVTVTGSGSYDRTVDWTLEKSVEPGTLSGVAGGSAGTATWTVDATKDVVEDNFLVTGAFEITNGNEMPVAFSVAATFAGEPVDDVTCLATTVAAGESVECTYTATPDDASAGRVTVMVTSLTDGVSGDEASADVSFTVNESGVASGTLADERLDYSESINSTKHLEVEEEFFCPTVTEADYVDGEYSFEEENVATLTLGDRVLNDSAVVNITCTYTAPPPPPAPPTPSGTVDKSADPDEGSVVMVGTEIEYTVVVRNDGLVAITDQPVVDTLPEYVTVVEGSVSDEGQISDDGNTITWRVSLAPDASETFTYTGLVADNAPLGASLVNTVEFLTHEDTTTHSVGATSLDIVKAVTPDDEPVEVGDTLTYTLTVTAGGNQPQSNVVVTDYVPGFDPARPDSGHTTYVEGSAQCLDEGPCVVSEPTADGLITWELGTMAPGTTRQVSFDVTVDDVELEEGQAAADILNAGVVESDQVPPTPSNEVQTPVTAVLGDKVGPGDSGDTTVVPVDTGGPEDDADTEVAGVKVSSGSLPQTGPGIPLGVTLGIATLLVLGGAVLMRVVRPRLSKR